jgi:hypothetical protein
MYNVSERYNLKTVAGVLEAVNEEACIDRSDVPDRVLRAKIWHAIVSFPGCLGDSHSIARSREGALSSVEYWLNDDDFSARYARGQLRRFGICYLRDGRVITLNEGTIGELF